MNERNCNRRTFVKALGLGAGAAALAGGGAAGERPSPAVEPLVVDPAPRFPLSPYLYMQFMEPLGVTDGSVDAAWDFGGDRWRGDVIEAARELAPTLLRWGGAFSAYYRWREGVGPRRKRPSMLNLCWGGIYNNQVGIAEFVEFCRAVGAEPLVCVNFESDGRPYWARSPWGDDRRGTAEEAAAWVAYCNDPHSKERIAHGIEEPLRVKLWQIGNETSYDPNAFTAEEAAQKTVAFAKAMRKADPELALIGWGEGDWAAPMAEIAGEHLQYLAFHPHYGPGGKDSPLRGIEYRKDPDRTWAYFMRTCKEAEARIRDMRERVKPYGIPLALTEGHYALPGRNRCEALSTWAAAVAYARIFHVFERNGDVVKIATLADFCGTRWQNNALMIPVPGGRPFLMPVALMMALYRRHAGEQAVSVTAAPADLDVTASRTGNRIFLHVANTNRTRCAAARLEVKGLRIAGGRAWTLAIDPEYEVFEHRPEVTTPKEAEIPAEGALTFPAASVSAVELETV